MIDGIEKLSESFEYDFINDDVVDLLSQAGDASLDIVYNNSVINNIPVIGLLKSAYDVYKSISAHRLAKKIFKLILGVGKYSPEDRKRFIVEYTEVNKEKGSEVLLSLLDRLDNVNKADVVASLLSNKIEGNITIKDFIRLTDALQKIPFIDIESLEKYESDYYESGESEMIYTTGLLYVSSISPTDSNKYRLNKLGWQLLKFGLGHDVEIPLDYSTSNSAYAVLR